MVIDLTSVGNNKVNLFCVVIYKFTFKTDANKHKPYLTFHWMIRMESPRAEVSSIKMSSAHRSTVQMYKKIQTTRLVEDIYIFARALRHLEWEHQNATSSRCVVIVCFCPNTPSRFLHRLNYNNRHPIFTGWLYLTGFAVVWTRESAQLLMIWPI